ncbi:hypothetical protein CI238_12214 [Colletotrichum incanum]|uniref:Uncharacterized protein n=1 Tax=Colletotrichum incanum TaxID=1573173 RepID=A0A161WRK9_COLIC|nr:hypothetical protein CI238_12214 [Colletotrichum incanum]
MSPSIKRQSPSVPKAAASNHPAGIATLQHKLLLTETIPRPRVVRSRLHQLLRTPTKRRRVVLPPFGVPSPSRRSGSSSPYKQGRNAALGIIRTISYDATKVPLALRDL